ncbi:hypothetical protein L522_0779 [Bordetella bronchiseptica MBORD707]|nr:hypothetical protein L522_0779 [Bordetella bronchiseptica MBORD707]
MTPAISHAGLDGRGRCPILGAIWQVDSCHIVGSWQTTLRPAGARRGAGVVARARLR